MKNLKNMIAAAGLMAVLVFGAISAKAESLTSDGTAKGQCTVKSEGILQNLAGIINGLTGISIFDTPACTDELPDSNRARWS